MQTSRNLLTFPAACLRHTLLAMAIGYVFSLSPLHAQAPPLNPPDWPALKGVWTFDNPADLLEASLGSDLILLGTHMAINGPAAGDGAVRIGQGSYYKCLHGIPANGGGSQVNEYSLLFDFRVPTLGSWYCFYQTHGANSNDGELFVSPSGTVGRTTNGPGYTAHVLEPGEWYRLVVTADLGNQYAIYLEGTLARLGGPLTVDGDFALSPQAMNNAFFFFADNDGEDAPIDVACCAVFEGVLSAEEVALLGGYGHPVLPVLTGIRPYLQSPTENSLFVCWHSDSSASSLVQYGTTSALGLQQSGSFEYIGTKKWHSVPLTGLLANTSYYYRCSSGGEQSGLLSFKTPPPLGLKQGHLRALVFGDSQTYPLQSSLVVNAARQKAQELFGDSLHEHLNLILHVGDVVGNGLSLQAYEDEFLNPFSSLSARLPMMAAIGNHEMDSPLYYQYVKYEGFNGAPFAIAERYFTYRIGRVQVIVINANSGYQDALQLLWIESTLAMAGSDSTIDFVLVYGHHPAYSELWPYGNTAYVQEEVMGLLKACPKVALYACGHTHGYERGLVDFDSIPRAFHSVIVGGAGGALDRWGMFSNQLNYPGTLKALDHYHFMLLDFDLLNASFNASVYSLGNPDYPLDCQLIDSFHLTRFGIPPQQPQAAWVEGLDQGLLSLHASPFNGNDSLLSSHFQLSALPGNYSDPIVDVIRDKDDYHGDSGPPDFIPQNLNQGVLLGSMVINSALDSAHAYGWRVRYRDQNLQWSDWSEEHVFVYKGGYEIQGAVNYDNGQLSGIEGVLLSLKKEGCLLALSYTDTGGYFQFPPQLPGNYLIEASLSAAWGGVNATDALLILQHFVGTSPLMGIRLLAADADANGYINAIDALMVAKRFVMQISSFPAPDWIIPPLSFTLGPTTPMPALKAICRGDVNGSWIP